ncbi:helix-turn-helix domain-containing protein [Limimaricola pyoseonensis]|uniref:HTH cro/C1-type domain-containing protein n=1 Tax=Limimaricola pyoseonensis TaxID=521013 RepID=A0A1G6ZN08_9RHOB|nr:helix-turn-helix domain-containing protein [Limimaricola pyoseonensis]SDE03597.1 hypothetical protein SAMN04488567_0593 [Limimaricola pyoseonensis]
MAERSLAGSRIRARRLDAGMRQADLAREAGISPSYLNLIEHNRRRIGGRLLQRIARALGVEPASLSEGAGGAVLARLRAAAAAAGQEADLAEEFAGRFPGWAELVAGQSRRIERLEAQVSALGDRLAHDPELSASLHQVIDAATAIRSTASILVGGEDLDRDWQDRFHRNIHAESLRLAENSRQLARFLKTPDAGDAPLSPQDEAERAFETLGPKLPLLETSRPGATPAELLREVEGLSEAGAALLSRWLGRHAADAALLPAEVIGGAWRRTPDPMAVARDTGAPLAAVLRRLAALPPGAGPARAGLAICDAGGAIGQRRGIEGVALPRGGTACPLWPLFEALLQPGRPLRCRVELPGLGEPTRLTAYAVAEIAAAPGWDRPARAEAVMLLLPDAPDLGALAPRPVGPGCRLCPRGDCAARREPSILPA